MHNKNYKICAVDDITTATRKSTFYFSLQQYTRPRAAISVPLEINTVTDDIWIQIFLNYLQIMYSVML